MPVRSADGLVGRIIDAGALISRVLLVSDRANIVPARLLRNGIPVISQGRGDGTIDVRPLEVGRNPFKRGDIIITSGTGGLYPPLVPIARVVKLDDDGAVAMPLADPSTTSFAIVEPPFEPAAVAAETTATRPRRPDGSRGPLPARGGSAKARRASRCCARPRSVVAASFLAALPIVSTSGWYPDFGFLALIAGGCFGPTRGRPGGPRRSASSTTCSPDIR